MTAIGEQIYIVTLRELYTVNRTTGVPTRVGNLPDFGASVTTAQAVAAIGQQLYMVSRTNRLYRLNKDTGQATLVGTAPFSLVTNDNAEGLTSDGTNLYLLTRVNAYRLNKDTGAVTFIVGFGDSGFEGQGFAYVNLPVALEEGEIGLGTSDENIPHIFVDTRPAQKIYMGARPSVGNEGDPVWENTNPPSIQTFSVTPTSIDLDSRATGNVSISFTAPAQTEVQTAEVFLVPQHTKVGQTYVTAANTGVSQTFTTPQPNQTQSYRLVLRTSGGAVHRDATVTVQKDLAITNFRRTGFTQDPTNPLRGLYRFAFRITGYPKPNSFVFSGVHSATTDDRHLTPVVAAVT